MQHFLEGLIMGLAYVAPIGLQNLFVINTAICQPIKKAYATALIVIFFDISLAFACFFGVGTIMERSFWLKLIILFSGSIVVVFIGISLLRSKSVTSNDTKVELPILKVISTACVVTWFNPQALIDGSVMLGAFKVALPSGESLKFILGVASASCLWFLSLSTVISLIEKNLTNKTLRIINIICGAVIILYGIKLAYNFVKLLISL